jgi:CHAT domain-containing protein
MRRHVVRLMGLHTLVAVPRLVSGGEVNADVFVTPFTAPHSRAASAADPYRPFAHPEYWAGFVTMGA